MKYFPSNLLPALRLFVEARNRAVEAGFTDNGGAIHSVERILDILSQRVCYPGLSHIANLRAWPGAEFSTAAYEVRDQREKLYIEHVLPQRAYAREVILLIGNGATDQEIIAHIRARYRLVILTREEARRLDRVNRSLIADGRLESAGIIMRPAPAGVP